MTANDFRHYELHLFTNHKIYWDLTWSLIKCWQWQPVTSTQVLFRIMHSAISLLHAYLKLDSANAMTWLIPKLRAAAMTNSAKLIARWIDVSSSTSYNHLCNCLFIFAVDDLVCQYVQSQCILNITSSSDFNGNYAFNMLCRYEALSMVILSKSLQYSVENKSRVSCWKMRF